MIDLFKEEINIGDKVKLILTTGKEPIGVVLEIGSNHILLKNDDGNTIRIFEVLIGGWEIIKVESINEQDESLSPQEDEGIQVKEEIAVSKDNPKVESDTIDSDEELSNNQETNEKIENTSVVEQKETKKTKRFIATDDNRIGITVVGKISLDKIDTNKKRFPSGRTYRLRQVSKTFDLPINVIVKILKQNKIKVDENNPNFRIDKLAYDIVDAEKDNYKNVKTPQDKYSHQESDDIGLKLNSLSDLGKLKEKIEFDISKQMLPAIVRYILI